MSEVKFDVEAWYAKYGLEPGVVNVGATKIRLQERVGDLINVEIARVKQAYIEEK